MWSKKIMSYFFSLIMSRASEPDIAESTLISVRLSNALNTFIFIFTSSTTSTFASGAVNVDFFFFLFDGSLYFSEISPIFKSEIIF